MIKIELRLFANLEKYMPTDFENFKIEENSNIKDLLFKLGISNDSIKIIFINGEKKDLKACLKNGDRVGLFPPVGGG